MAYIIKLVVYVNHCVGVSPFDVSLPKHLYCCDYRGVDIHENNDTFEKSYLLIGLSIFAQTFAVRFVKSLYIYPICINAWGSLSFNQ